MAKTENLLTWRATTLKILTRYKYDRLAIKYLKFKKSRRKFTVTNKTSDTKRYKNILSHSIASKQATWYEKVIKIYVNKKIKHKINDEETKEEKEVIAIESE